MAFDTFDPWWADKALSEVETEREARRQDRLEAEAFQAKIDAAIASDKARSPFFCADDYR